MTIGNLVGIVKIAIFDRQLIEITKIVILRFTSSNLIKLILNVMVASENKGGTVGNFINNIKNIDTSTH